MHSNTTMYFGDVLVIFEGRRRIGWQRRGRAEWVPVSVWPNQQQAERVRRHIAVGEPVLIVAESVQTSVVVLDEQLAAAPPAVTALAGDDTGEAVELRIEAFDWLPESLRARGSAFLRESARRAAAAPQSLTAPAVLEEPASHVANLRFLHVTRSCPRLETELPAIVDAGFGRSLRATA